MTIPLVAQCSLTSLLTQMYDFYERSQQALDSSCPAEVYFRTGSAGETIDQMSRSPWRPMLLQHGCKGTGVAEDQEEQKEKGLVEPLRKYGREPFRVVVVHGGPGALGSVAPLARQLGQSRGVLEPLQTATTVDGQVEELRLTVEQQATPPVILIGHSWGAWLSALVAAASPGLVRKLILVGSGPFEEQYVPTIAQNRFHRLSHEEQEEYQQLVERLDRSGGPARAASLARLGKLSEKCDAYDPLELPNDSEELDGLADPVAMYQGVWPQAAALRASGELLRRVATITCPVVALHGDDDPHPAEGVQYPLASRLQDFRIITLKHCGHTPWGERQAREQFYEILERELSAVF